MTTTTTRSGETESLLGGGDARVRARETRSMGDAKQSAIHGVHTMFNTMDLRLMYVSTTDVTTHRL